MRRADATADLDLVVVARQEAIAVEVQRLFGAVGGEVAGPGNSQPPLLLPGLLLRHKRTRLGSGQGGERLRQVGPHRRAHEVHQLKGAPRSLSCVPRERVARLVEGLDDGSVAVVDRTSFGREQTVSVGRAERAV